MSLRVPQTPKVPNTQLLPRLHTLQKRPVMHVMAREGGKRKEPAMAMPESSTQVLGEPSRMQDPGEIYWKAYGCPPVHPAIRRIRDEARREQMLSSRNLSEPCSVSTPRFLVLQAADDDANAANNARGVLGICITTARLMARFLPLDIPSVQDAQGESTDDTPMLLAQIAANWMPETVH